MKEISAVIIGKNYSTTLGLVEAIGRAGYCCGVVKPVKEIPRFATPEQKSQYVVRCEYAVMNDEEDILEKALSFRQKSRKIALIPSDDFSASLLDRKLDSLSESFYVPNVREKAGELTALMDKYTQKQLALSSGVDAAACFSVEVSDGKVTIPEGIIYPCFTKPQASIGLSKSYIRKCDDREALIRHLTMIGRQQPCTILVEEAIDVENEYTVPGVCVGSKAVIPALLKKHKIGSGKHKGVTIRGEVQSSARYQTLTEQLCRFIESLGLTGIFDIELLESKGRFYLNEINLRYSAAGYAVTAAGVNLPGLYLDYLFGKKITPEQLKRDGMIFVSEKAELEDFEAGYSTFRNYLRSVKNADIRFMTGINDPPAEAAFKKIVWKTAAKRLLKR